MGIGNIYTGLETSIRQSVLQDAQVCMLLVSIKKHGGVEQKIVCPPSGVFTDTKIQTFPCTMFCRTPINISEALTWSIKPTGGILTLIFTKILPLHKN